MAEKSPGDTSEFYVPENGLELAPYLATENLTAVHHLARYFWAIRVLACREPGVILDVATGAGYGAYLMAKYLPRFTIIGADYDPRSVEFARRNYQEHGLTNLSYCHFDLEEWRVVNGDSQLGQLDYITSFDTIEHLLHREIALINLAEFIAPSGMLLLSTPSSTETNILNPEWVHHKIEYSYRYLYNLMRRFFKVVDIPDNGSLPELDYWNDVVNRGTLRYPLRVNPIACSVPIVFGLGDIG